MEILRAALGLEPGAYRQDPRLKELGFGEWEGRTWKEIRADEPQAFAERERDRWRFAPPGGESYADAVDRVQAVLATVTEPTLLVSHGGIARIVLTLRSRVHHRDALTASIWQGRILLFQARSHRWI